VTALPKIRRARGEEGFLLIELMIAMVVLTAGILALVAAYSSGYVTLRRATQVSSATLIADSQMERFRALQYANILLNTSCGTTCNVDSTYTGDSAYSSGAQIAGCATTDSSCIASQTKTGPDGKSYRLDTYVDWSCANPADTLTTTPSVSCSSGQTPIKLVTVVVRRAGGGDWVREQSTFTSLLSS
jgi:type II secretory pathway pseudopilin PulG